MVSVKMVMAGAGPAVSRFPDHAGLAWPDRPQIRAPEPSAAQQATDALRLRYAKGEISREEYLQGKAELEDSPDPVA